MTPLYGYDAQVADFVSWRIFGRPGAFRDYAAIGFLEHGRLKAGTVFHNHYPECGIIEMSSASESARWLDRPTLRAIFVYPFADLGCQTVVMRVSERNERMCGIARRFGFAETRIPRLRGRDEDEMIYTLTDDVFFAKWAGALGLKGMSNGQVFPVTADTA